MIELSTYHRLGLKTLYIFILERMFGPLAIFFGIMVVIVLRSIDESFLMSTFSMSVAGVSAINSLVDLFVLLLVVLWIIIIALGAFIAWLDYHYYQFCLDDHALEIKRGIIHKEELSIPYNHIENVEMDQGFLSQVFGVCRLVILTAGHEYEGHENQDGGANESEGILPTIDKGFAEELKQELLSRANVHIQE